MVCDKVYLAVVLISSVFSCNKRQSSLFDEAPWMRIYDSKVPFGGFDFRQISRIQRKKSFFAVFKCLQFNITNTPKQCVLRWLVLNPSTHILGSMFCYPLVAIINTHTPVLLHRLLWDRAINSRKQIPPRQCLRPRELTQNAPFSSVEKQSSTGFTGGG